MTVEIIKTFIYFLTGGFLIFLAITITRDNFANRLNRLAGLLCFFAGLGPLALALGMIVSNTVAADPNFSQSTLYNLYFLWELFFPVLLLFAWSYPIDRMRELRHPRLRFAIFLPYVVHLIVVIFYPQISRLLEALVIATTTEGFMSILLRPFSWLVTQIQLFLAYVRNNHEIMIVVVNTIYAAAAMYFVESGRRLVTNPRLLTQTRMVAWSLRVCLGLYLLGLGVCTVAHVKMTDPLCAFVLIAAMLAGTTLFATAVIRHQFLDIRAIFRQSIIYTVALGLLVGLYIVLAMRAKDVLTPLFGEQAGLVSYIFIVFILLLFQPIATWVDNVIRSMFIRTRTDYRNILERFSRQVISLFDPKQLRQEIEETLKVSLLVEHVYFVLFDDSVGEYAVLPSEDYARRTIIDRNDLMLRGINLLDSPTFLDALSDYEQNSPLADLLKEVRARLILPMKDAQHLLGFIALSSKVAGYRYTSEDLNLLKVLSNQMVTALTNARLYADSMERLRLQEEMTMARQIQLNLLPSKPPDFPSMAIMAQSTPSRTVGGDFYDFISINEGQRIGIVIADASGKGMPAALLIAQIQAIIRSEVYNGNAIATIMRNMNKLICQSTTAEKYVTLFYGELEPATGRFHFSNAGHNYPVLVRADGRVELLEIGGPIIGAFPFMEYTSAFVDLCPEDVILFYTDGLSEAMDGEGKEFGEDRVRQMVVDTRHHDPRVITQNLLDTVRKFDPSVPPQDDTTTIVLKMRNGNTSHE